MASTKKAAAKTSNQKAGSNASTRQGAPSAQQARSFRKRITRTVGLEYLLHLPKGYEEDPARRWPLVLFLHGAGERGDDLSKVKVHGIPKVVEKAPARVKELPFIAVSPQCPAGSWWSHLDNVLALSALLDEIEVTHRVDPDRIYLTGLSMGGFGTFALAGAEPERFAALLPICGGGDRVSAMRASKIPTWVFHGARDETVPLRSSVEMVETMARSGGSPRFTVYPDAGHDSWTQTYENPEVYRWLLSQVRPPKAPQPSGR
jgi:predicted peptidase